MSDRHKQEFGISQGCPLSPFLFVMVMSVLLHDAKKKLVSTGEVELSTELVVNELVYADDTLLIDTSSTTLQVFMDCIADVGAEYGMTFNWKKLEMLPVRTTGQIKKPDGDAIKSKDSMLYLGSLLSADGGVASEMGRRLGMAQSDFQTLDRIWKHSTLSRTKKIRIFNACICTKLCYGLFTAALNLKDRRRIDGFQARCLRKILKIPSSYYSRISNATVLEIAGETLLSTKILGEQQRYLTKISARPHDDATRLCIYQPGSENLRESTYERGRGRPRRTWIAGVAGH